MTGGNEIRLLFACARLRLEAADRAELERCVASAPDWDRVLALARWHGLRPLLHRHLSQVAGVPREILVQCWIDAERVARSNRAARAELERVLGVLEAARIRALPYKGPALALRAYGDLGLREFGDLDILVPRDEVRRAADLLCAAGYAREYELTPDIEQAFVESDAQYHLGLRATTGGLAELHWKSDADFPVERLDDADWWRAAGAIDGLRTFGDEELLLVLCIHGSKHGWSSLGWLVDVAELLRSSREVDWARLAARARSLGASRRVGLGFALASRLLGAPLGPGCDDLAAHADVARVATILEAELRASEPRDWGPWESVRLQWAMDDARFEGIRRVIRTVCLPSLVEWTRWPLPKPLFFAYPVLRMGRLAGKYLGRALKGAFRGRKLQS